MKSNKSPNASRFIDELLGQGRYTFTREEAVRRLQTSSAAVYMSLHRLAKTGRLAMPRSGFYIIVDPQHRAAGTLPPEWFIHNLMKEMGRAYYVGLLSAAQLHGSAHHRPQEFQVMIPQRAVRPILVGNVRIRFFGKGPFDYSAIADAKTPTGIMKVSSPETTAWDLVRYPKAVGGQENLVTVLAELAEKLDETELGETVKRHGEIIVAQRLGYILEHLGRPRLAGKLADWVRAAPLRPLDPSAPVSKAAMNRRWHLLINRDLKAEA